MIGSMFAATECVIESIRGKTDHTASVHNNSVIAGGIVGGALGFRGKLCLSWWCPGVHFGRTTARVWSVHGCGLHWRGPLWSDWGGLYAFVVVAALNCGLSRPLTPSVVGACAVRSWPTGSTLRRSNLCSLLRGHRSFYEGLNYGLCA